MLMRPILLLLAITVGSLSGVAAAAESSYEAGYRNCDLKHLGACQNSNQLFAGLPGSAPKRDFSDALTSFLASAPEYDTFGYRFSAAEVAQESLTGRKAHPFIFRQGNGSSTASRPTMP